MEIESRVLRGQADAHPLMKTSESLSDHPEYVHDDILVPTSALPSRFAGVLKKSKPEAFI